VFVGWGFGLGGGGWGGWVFVGGLVFLVGVWGVWAMDATNQLLLSLHGMGKKIRNPRNIKRRKNYLASRDRVGGEFTTVREVGRA